MSTGIFDDAAGRERLSALVDGELDRSDADAACGAWRADAELRRTWHAWHAIGDTLRSDDLASDPVADVRFCAAVSARLAAEAVVLAPARPLAAVESAPPASLRSRWAFGSAVAAGLVLVAGTFALVGPGTAPGPERIALADETAAASSADSARSRTTPTLVSAPAGVDVQAPEVVSVADLKVIHDAQLDRYLVAHKQFAGSSALGVPSAFLRSATVDSASR
jgi:sigma-E factor negative regulatory protein RseA